MKIFLLAAIAPLVVTLNGCMCYGEGECRTIPLGLPEGGSWGGGGGYTAPAKPVQPQKPMSPTDPSELFHSDEFGGQNYNATGRRAHAVSTYDDCENILRNQYRGMNARMQTFQSTRPNSDLRWLCVIIFDEDEQADTNVFEDRRYNSRSEYEADPNVPDNAPQFRPTQRSTHREFRRSRYGGY